ncbi:MAG: hypothetical protein ONB05_11170, partial [candidate division KSB1 bacterium]|nr:hypothetical protein [candidate division KSB1 bacterium]
MKPFLITILVGFFMLPEPGFSQKIMERLEVDLAKGQIPFNDYLVYKALTLKEPQKLPLEYRTLANEPIKCGTFINLQIKQNWDKLDRVQQSLLAPYFQRPQLPNSLISDSKRFKIHYTTTGKDAISTVDLNS